jgi:hypothetical protein
VAGPATVRVGPRNGSAGVYTMPGSPFDAGSGANHSISLSGLNNGTYHYQLVMTDGCGVDHASGDRTFVAS